MQQHHSSLIGKSYNSTINCNDTDRFILLNLNEAKNDFVVRLQSLRKQICLGVSQQITSLENALQINV